MTQPCNESRRRLIKSCVSIGLCATLARTGRAQANSHSRATQWRATGQEIPELASFEQVMHSFMQARSIPAGALAVAKNGKLILARAYTATGEGMLTQPNSLFRIASLSKPLTAAAVLRLIQENRLDLAARLTDILPAGTHVTRAPDQRLHEVTVQQLLQHLGGWDRNQSFDPMFRDRIIAQDFDTGLPVSQDHILTYMWSQPLQHAPGTTYAYSNYGYCLLGQIISRITQQPYQAFVQQAILSPLGITRPRLGRTLPKYRRLNEVSYHSQNQGRTVLDSSRAMVPSPYGAWNLENMDAHGGWLASAVDLVRFAVGLDEAQDSPILNGKTRATMFALPENIDTENYQAGEAYYGCGWSVRDWGQGKRNIWHTGSLPGTHTLLVKRWQDELTWCVLFNQRDDPSGLSYGAIDGLLHEAANDVKQWPDHDLFSAYL